MDNKKFYQKAFDSVTISDSAVESLNKSLDMKKAPKNPVRILRFVPAMAIILTMGITVAAVSLSNRDTVENIYFDRDVQHNLIMDFNPQYGTYLTEEGIEQLESFKPIALDVTDHSGNGNDLKSATLLGVMADKYTMTSLIEITFDKDITVPADNVAMMERRTPGAVCFLTCTVEDGDLRYGDETFYAAVSVSFDYYREFVNSFDKIKPKSKDKHASPFIDNEFQTNVDIIPVADKPNTVIAYIEEHRADEGYPFEKNSTVRYILDEFGVLKGENMWEPLSDGTYIFDIPTPKKLIPAEKIKTDGEFVYRGCKYNIKSLERSQSYIEITYTCEILPEFYEGYKYYWEAGVDDGKSWYKVDSPYIQVRTDNGRRIPTGVKYASTGLVMKTLTFGEEYPPLDSSAEHTAIIHFEKPQNEESVGDITFGYACENGELCIIPLK